MDLLTLCQLDWWESSLFHSAFIPKLLIELSKCKYRRCKRLRNALRINDTLQTKVLLSGCKIRRDWLWLVYLWREPPSLAKKRILTPKKEPYCKLSNTWKNGWKAFKCTFLCNKALVITLNFLVYIESFKLSFKIKFRY